MTGLIIFLAILLFFLFLLSIRLKITIEYNDSLCVYVRILYFIRIPITPGKEKRLKLSEYSDKKIARRDRAKQEKAVQKEQKKQEKKAKKAEKKKRLKEHPEEAKHERTLSENLSLIIDVVKVLLGRFFRHLRIDLSRIHISVASEDAAQTAILYGIVSQSVAYLLELLGHFKTVSTPDLSDVSVTPNWVSEQTEVDIKLSFSLRIGHLFDILFRVIGRAIKHLFQDKRQKEKQTALTSTKSQHAFPRTNAGCKH